MSINNEPIPKILHLFWDGDQALPVYAEHTIIAATQYGYEINKISALDLPPSQARDWALENKRWSVLSELARHYFVWQQGGVYVDTDMEWLRDPHELIKDMYWVAGGEHPEFPNAAFSAGKKGNKLSEMLYHGVKDMAGPFYSGKLPIEVAVGPWLLRDTLRDHFHVKIEPTITRYNHAFDAAGQECLILSQELAFGGGYKEYRLFKQKPSYGGFFIHHWAKSW
jgi:hypothetical protein